MPPLPPKKKNSNALLMARSCLLIVLANWSKILNNSMAKDRTTERPLSVPCCEKALALENEISDHFDRRRARQHAQRRPISKNLDGHITRSWKTLRVYTAAGFVTSSRRNWNKWFKISAVAKPNHSNYWITLNMIRFHFNQNAFVSGWEKWTKRSGKWIKTNNTNINGFPFQRVWNSIVGR